MGRAAPAPRSAVYGALVALAAACVGAARADAKIVVSSMFSPANGRNISYRVYTPPEYDPAAAKRYPVVFSLHGAGSDPSQRSNLLAPTLDVKIASGALLPMIWVFPDGQDNSYYGNAYDGHKQVEANIIDELVPRIDATYRTYGDRRGRAIDGFSMGGFGSGLYGATASEVFSAALLSGAALPTWNALKVREADVAREMYDNRESNWLPYSVWDQTGANAATIRRDVNYKMIVGALDQHYDANIEFRDYVVSLGIDPKFQVLPGIAHVGRDYLNEGSGLRFLNEHFVAMSKLLNAQPLSADFNDSGAVTAADLAVWKTAFKRTAAGDADGDADTDGADFLAWQRQLGRSSTAAAATSARAVPEPASAMLAAALVASVLARRTRISLRVSSRA